MIKIQELRSLHFKGCCFTDLLLKALSPLVSKLGFEQERSSRPQVHNNDMA